MKILLIPAVALIAGCSSMDKQYAAHLAAAQSIAQANALASQEKVRQMGEIAKSAKDSGSAVAAVMAMAMVQTPHINIPAPPESQALKWVSVLAPTLTNIATAGFSYRAGVVASNNSRDVTVAGYQTFGSMANAGYAAINSTASAGFAANRDIASFIQAPQPNVTLSGTGVIGSGSYTAPVTTTTTSNSNNTTRTCAGGNGAAGGAGAPGGGSGDAGTGGSGAPGGNGAAGGSANC